MTLSFDRLHSLLDDAQLDRLSVRSGWRSGIGRLSFTSDRVVEHLSATLESRKAKRILDLGCGRGFLGRWLGSYGPTIRYTGVDFSVHALAAARRFLPDGQLIHANYRSIGSGSYDAVVLLDALFNDAIDDGFAAHLISLLPQGGTIFIATSILSERHGERFAQSALTFEQYGCALNVKDWTTEVAAATMRAANAWLCEPGWPDEAKTMLQSEARALIESIETRQYRYISIDAVHRVDH